MIVWRLHRRRCVHAGMCRLLRVNVAVVRGSTTVVVVVVWRLLQRVVVVVAVVRIGRLLRVQLLVRVGTWGLLLLLGLSVGRLWNLRRRMHRCAGRGTGAGGCSVGVRYVSRVSRAGLGRGLAAIFLLA